MEQKQKEQKEQKKNPKAERKPLKNAFLVETKVTFCTLRHRSSVIV
jgi:hypothetical protein